jgi:predicted secreted Zn-dependent protease
VEVDLRYQVFRVFGDSIGELNRSLRIRALHVEGELAAGLTTSRFELSYESFRSSEGCTLRPRLKLELAITVPEWEPPATAGRYLRNQWNQFMWHLDEHERHHAELWVQAANRMVQVVDGMPPGSSCRQARTTANARVDRVFKRYERLQRAFDRDVAAGRQPAPSLP